jgi:hypothetical protein
MQFARTIKGQNMPEGEMRGLAMLRKSKNPNKNINFQGNYEIAQNK